MLAAADQPQRVNGTVVRESDVLNRVPTVSVVIPTYRGWPVLKTCLESLEHQRYDSLEVIVVDDGSCDGTAERVRKAFTACGVIALPEKSGFAAAVNEGIRAAQG